MTIKIFCTAVLLSLVSIQSLADSKQSLVSDSPNLQTEMWLQLQREGNAKSKKVQTATPVERELAMQRLLKSYEYLIPEYYSESDSGKFKR